MSKNRLSNSIATIKAIKDRPVLSTVLLTIGLTAAIVIVICYLLFVKQSTVVQFVYNQF